VKYVPLQTLRKAILIVLISAAIVQISARFVPAFRQELQLMQDIYVQFARRSAKLVLMNAISTPNITSIAGNAPKHAGNVPLSAGKWQI
jgi:hypothetical protein